MSEARVRRLRSLADLLREGEVASQEEATVRLRALGHNVTQATVSRDLERLGAIRVKRAGRPTYALPDSLADADFNADRLQRILREWVVTIEAAGPLIVMRTPPGSAHLVGSALDQAQLPEIAGTVAGDDTLFLAVRDGHPIPALLARFARLAGQSKETYA